MPRKTVREQVMTDIVGGPVKWTTDLESILVVAHATAGDDGVDGKELSMDLSAVNANGCPLDFEKLLSFPPFDFWHDVHGIQQHIDRETGKLMDFFLPRCTKRQSL